MARGMCAWSSCSKEPMLSLTGDYGLAATKKRDGFCCLEHLIAWAVRRAALPIHGVSTSQEENIEKSVLSLIEEVKKA